jgi:S1-C subfamily serine protease
MHIASNPALPASRHLRGPVIWFAAVLAIVLVATLVSFGLGDRHRSQTNSTDAFAATARSLVQSQEAAPRSPATKTIASVLPSVVNVRVVKVGASASGQVGEAKAEGSGVVIAPNGVIVTNNHVVQGAVQVRVVFTDGHPTMPGTVVGTDPQHDIAVVKVDASGLNPATLGRSSELALAETVYAIGFPLDLGVTVTRGIVSGLDRSVAFRVNRPSNTSSACCRPTPRSTRGTRAVRSSTRLGTSSASTPQARPRRRPTMSDSRSRSTMPFP